MIQQQHVSHNKGWSVIQQQPASQNKRWSVIQQQHASQNKSWFVIQQQLASQNKGWSQNKGTTQSCHSIIDTFTPNRAVLLNLNSQL